MSKIIKVLFTITIIALICRIVFARLDLSQWMNKLGVVDLEENYKEFVNDVRRSMLEGKKDVTLNYYGDLQGKTSETFVQDAIDDATNIDVQITSSDYDYLKNNFKSMTAEIKGLGNHYKIIYHFNYHESNEETKEVDDKVKTVLEKMKINMLPDYEKIKKIHDYIIENASYDQNYKKYSAYSNLIEKSSVCQGYAGITYKMMTEAGIPCRIITGNGQGQSHAWNIVQLKGKWYNIDCTWDDPVYSDGSESIRYEYFLRTDFEFEVDHQRDAEFLTDEFKERYPMAEEAYK